MKRLVLVKRLVLCLVLLTPGCVSAAVHNAAVKLENDLAILNSATVPDPSYGPIGQRKVEQLKSEVLRTAHLIAEETK